MENNTCVCKPFYEGDGITCTGTYMKISIAKIDDKTKVNHPLTLTSSAAANMCKFWNGGCSNDAKCSQKGEKVSCTCFKGFSGDGYECSPVDPCADGENGECHEHATCTMTGAVSSTFSNYSSFKRTWSLYINLCTSINICNVHLSPGKEEVWL